MLRLSSRRQLGAELRSCAELKLPIHLEAATYPATCTGCCGSRSRPASSPGLSRAVVVNDDAHPAGSPRGPKHLA